MYDVDMDTPLFTSFDLEDGQHSLRLRLMDAKEDETAIYEGLVDNMMYVFFESLPNVTVEVLTGLAKKSYLEEVQDSDTELNGWAGDHGY